MSRKALMGVVLVLVVTLAAGTALACRNPKLTACLDVCLKGNDFTPSQVESCVMSCIKQTKFQNTKKVDVKKDIMDCYDAYEKCDAGCGSDVACKLKCRKSLINCLGSKICNK